MNAACEKWINCIKQSLPGLPLDLSSSPHSKSYLTMSPEGTMKALWYNAVRIFPVLSILDPNSCIAQGFHYQEGAHTSSQ